MPESTTFRVSTYHKLAKDEHGLTQWGSVRLDAAAALGVILAEFPEDAAKVLHTRPEGADWDVVTLVIDWNKVPDSLRDPSIPARRR